MSLNGSTEYVDAPSESPGDPACGEEEPKVKGEEQARQGGAQDTPPRAQTQGAQWQACASLWRGSARHCSP